MNLKTKKMNEKEDFSNRLDYLIVEYVVASHSDIVDIVHYPNEDDWSKQLTKKID